MTDPVWAVVERLKAREFRRKMLAREAQIHPELKGNNQAAKEVYEDWWPIIDKVVEW